MTTEPKLTDEQVEFAAEFMGWKKKGDYWEVMNPVIKWPYSNVIYDNILPHVIAVPEAERAVMDRAVEKYAYIDLRRISGTFDYSLRVESWDIPIRGHGPTRFTALLAALQEAGR